MGEQTFNHSDDQLEQHIITLFEKLECLRKDANSSDLSGRVPARLELRTLGLWKAVVAECAASFLYVFIVCGAAGGAGVGASASAVLLTTALASGCAIATLTMCFAKISGAHVNPSVTAALCIRRRVSPLRTALYIAAQCGGGIAGAAAIYGSKKRKVSANNDDVGQPASETKHHDVSVPGYAGSLSSSLPGGGAAAWERLGAEMVLSALVASAYFAAMDRRWTGSAPMLLGTAYCAASFVSMPSLNPARSLGPSFVLSRWDGHWVCWVGGVGGGVLAALAHDWLKRRPRGSSRASSPRDLDELDKPAFPHHHYRPTYCAAAPRPDTAEPLYSGTKSLYCRSPPPARHTLHRSQSVYSKGSSVPSGPVAAGPGAGGGGGALAAAQALVLRPAAVAHAHALAHTQNAQNAQRDPPYGTNGIRQVPTGAAVSERRESLYSAGGACASVSSAGTGGCGGSALGGPRRLPSEDSAYGTYRAPPYRAHPPDHY